MTALVLACLAGACDRDDAIVERRAPKGVEVIAAPTPERNAAGKAVAHTHAPDALWTVPEGWQEIPSDNRVRLAVFTIDDAPGAEVVVTRFPGSVGGALANVNRWRAQIGLRPIEASDLDTSIERFSLRGFDGYILTITNNERGVVGVGLEEPARSRTWFVKATTPEASLERVRGSVAAFARSFTIPQGGE